MIFPEYTIDEWTKKYPGLTPRSTTCLKCDGTITANIPFITKDYAGFVAFKCPECNSEKRINVSIAISKNEIAQWQEAFHIN